MGDKVAGGGERKKREAGTDSLIITEWQLVGIMSATKTLVNNNNVYCIRHR